MIHVRLTCSHCKDTLTVEAERQPDAVAQMRALAAGAGFRCIGSHLYCGDCLDAAAERVVAVVTRPAHEVRLACDACQFTIVAGASTRQAAEASCLEQSRLAGFGVSLLGLLCGACRKRVAGSLFGRVEVAQA